jgi:putative ABC transport system permease protein
MGGFVRDLRHALRLLARAPGFSAVAIAALALGIGVNAAVFSVVNAVLLRPLPYEDPDRLAIIWEHNIPRDRKNNVVAPGNFLHWRAMNTSFTDVAAVGLTFPITLTGSGEPEEIPMQLVSAQLFPLLGISPQIGRTFAADEDRPEARLAVISDRLWQRRFQRSPEILSHPITLAGRPYTVLGVMPPAFSFLDKTVDLWLPIGLPAEAWTPRGRWIAVLGRLRPGVTFAQAQEDMTRVHAELARLYPKFNTGWTARVVPLKEQVTGNVRPPLLMLLAAVALVLLIACANVANLLLARATARQRELAVRAALGATRLRLARQLLAESLVLSLAGGGAGVMLAFWTVQVLRTAVLDRLPVLRLEQVTVDGRVLAFALLLSILSAFLFGIAPAISGARQFGNTLRDAGRSTGARGTRTRGTLVITEVALALVLLVGAGLLLRSFTRLLDVNPGFDPANTVTLHLSLPEARYPTDAARQQFFERLFDRLDSLPGVQAAGAISFLPLSGPGSATSMEIIGKPAPPPGQERVADVRVVAGDFFRAMGVPLVAGRLFDSREAADPARHVIVINETMARTSWPGEDPIGKRVRISWTGNIEDEVIGVVGDVRYGALDVAPRATTYWPYPRTTYSGMTLTIRSTGEPSATAKSAVDVIRRQDPLLAAAEIRTLDEVVSSSVAERRLLVLLLSVFAATAVVLASVGIYGVIAYSVTQRTQEIGIRVALGAGSRQLLGMIVGQALALVLAGVAAGGLIALLVTRLLSGFLFEVAPRDPATFLAAAAALAGVGLLASYLPARRATRVDPVIALRGE